MKIAVVGGGLFGVTTAINISDLGDVHLYESNKDILCGASFANQRRLHSGFHYPRSPETVTELQASLPSFMEWYGSATVSTYPHYYCLAASGSKVDAETYKEFCRRQNLHFGECSLEGLNTDQIEAVFKVKESIINYWSLKDICLKKLASCDVDVHVSSAFLRDDVDKYDIVVNCTYSGLNSILEDGSRRQYQFEVCEKIVCRPCNTLKGVSVVVMDGPFMCFDPLAGMDEKSLMGNVVHAIHSTNVGYTPVIPEHLSRHINAGLRHLPKISSFERFVSSAERFFCDVGQTEYIGSMFTVRCVLPNTDQTDERPTLVNRVDPKLINVFSGKLDTCVIAADNVRKLIIGHN